MTESPRHLLWILAAALVGFSSSFLLGDRVALPVDLYYLLYFAVILGFLAVYARTTRLDARAWVGRRLGRGVVLGILAGLVLAQGVLSRPETAKLSGAELWWAVLWRGVVYGSVDGLLLLGFPWLVVWRALDAERRRMPGRIGAGALALVGILFVTTIYHLGYGDFRSRRVAQPALGSGIASVPTLVAANPVASVISHVFLHVTAVIHSPETDLFLPPHRERAVTVP